LPPGPRPPPAADVRPVPVPPPATPAPFPCPLRARPLSRAAPPAADPPRRRPGPAPPRASAPRPGTPPLPLRRLRPSAPARRLRPSSPHAPSAAHRPRHAASAPRRPGAPPPRLSAPPPRRPSPPTPWLVPPTPARTRVPATTGDPRRPPATSATPDDPSAAPDPVVPGDPGPPPASTRPQHRRGPQAAGVAALLLQLALDDLPYNTFDMPEEVQEQVALVHSQFKRAATRTDPPDTQLSKDLSSALANKTCDPAVLTRISEKLQLQTMADMKKESVALHEMVISSGGEPDGCVEEMSSLLKKLKDCVITEPPPTTDTLSTRSGSISHRSPIIPDEFRCPISLELMQDPVIVSSGQTYERSCIQKWLDSGHKTCPKTQQPLSHTSLTPNFVLKSLIAQWCEANGIELPKNKVNSRDKKASKSSDYDHAGLVSLMSRLRSGNQDEQRAAAGEIRLLAKRNVNNRICIAEAGAIPLLVNLLSSSDPRTQEHAVTALLNLSIHENNKASIVGSHAIPKIVEVLKTGSMEARENAAATLFSLSVVDENKVTIGAAGAIPPLINLLCNGSPRGKKDAATAIFNLCIYQGIRSGQ
ncbi:hypothetical protein EJB05_46599, partial [Eragrostis curvula]